MVLSTKKRLLKKSKLALGVFETRPEDLKHYENAYMTALKALTLQTINIKTSLKDFNVEQLQGILMIFDDRSKTPVDLKIRRLAGLIKEVQILNIIEDKIIHAKTKIKEVFEESFTVQYTKTNGKWNIDKFTNDVDNQLEKLNEANNQMDDNI